MNVQIIKHWAIYCVALLIVVIIISIVITNDNQAATYLDVSSKQVSTVQDKGKQNQGQKKDNQAGSAADSIRKKLSPKYLMIRKMISTNYGIKLVDNYMKKSIDVVISGEDMKVFDEDAVIRVNEGLSFDTIPQKDAADNSSDSLETEKIDPVISYHISYNKVIDGKTKEANITINLDHIYAYEVFQDTDYIYINLRKPKEVYDKLLVVDAGHGGGDCGTFTEDLSHYEKDINLAILLYLKEILDQKDIKVYYTRTTDSSVKLNDRVGLANEVEADYFISIHCNADISTQPQGCDVLYNELADTTIVPSEQFAQICLDEVSKATNQVHTGLVKGNDILIVRKANMPMALVEVAFMSNPVDLDFLLQANNQRNVASALDQGIERAFRELGQ